MAIQNLKQLLTPQAPAAAGDLRSQYFRRDGKEMYAGAAQQYALAMQSQGGSPTAPAGFDPSMLNAPGSFAGAGTYGNGYVDPAMLGAPGADQPAGVDPAWQSSAGNLDVTAPGYAPDYAHSINGGGGMTISPGVPGTGGPMAGGAGGSGSVGGFAGYGGASAGGGGMGVGAGGAGGAGAGMGTGGGAGGGATSGGMGSGGTISKPTSTGGGTGGGYISSITNTNKPTAPTTTDLTTASAKLEADANKRNEKRLADLNKSITGSQRALGTDFEQMMATLNNSDQYQQTLADEEAKKQQGDLMQQMVSRGLGGTTVLPSLQAQIARNTGVQKQNIASNAVGQKLGVLGQRSGAIESTRKEGRTINQDVTDLGPQLQQLLPLLMSMMKGA